MLIFNTDVPGGHSQEHAREYLRQIGRKRVDGLIVGDFALHNMHEALLEIDLPAVFIGNLPNRAVDSVQLDDHGGGYLMGDYLAGKGHSRVAHITGPGFFEEAMARASGFEQGLENGGLQSEQILRYEGSYLPPSGREAVNWLLDKHASGLPSAIFCANYLMATGVLSELYDRGIRVPQDIAVAVFGELPQLEYVRPRLTRVGSGPSVLAERAVAMLLERKNGEFTGPVRTEVLPCTLHEGDSA
jgi:DNA-binding LacI/PurR family transcriptional regulator